MSGDASGGELRDVDLLAGSLQRLSVQMLESYKVEEKASHRGGRKPLQGRPCCTTEHGQPRCRKRQQGGSRRQQVCAPDVPHSSISTTAGPATKDIAGQTQKSPGATSVLPAGLKLAVGPPPAAQSTPAPITGLTLRSSPRGPPPVPSSAPSTSRSGASTAPSGVQRGSAVALGRKGSVVMGAGGSKDGKAVRSSLALRESVMAMLGRKQELERKIGEGTPTIMPPSDRPAILHVLEQQPSQRGGVRELAPVLRMLQKVPFLAAVEGQGLAEISRWVRYQFLEPGHVVFNQGDSGTLFYIIASGKVRVVVSGASQGGDPGQQQQQQQQVAPSQQVPAVEEPSAASASSAPDLPDEAVGGGGVVEIVLEAGQCFGEKALTKAGLGKRSATVCTLTECELLTLDIHQYTALLARLHEEELVAKVKVLRGFDVSAGWSEQQLREVAGVLTLRRFAADRVVVQQGSPSASLFFIKAGEVRIVRHMPSNARLRRLLSNSVMAAQFQPDSRLRDRLKATAFTGTSPCSRHSTALDLYHHMLPLDEGRGGAEDVYVEIATLGPHEIFGEVGAPEGQWRQASIITSTYTQLLELTRHDLLTRLKGGCRMSLQALREQYLPDDALLDSLAQEVEWQRYKHRLVAGVLWAGGNLSGLVDYHRQAQKDGATGGSNKAMPG